jgi:hypothetical protein
VEQYFSEDGGITLAQSIQNETVIAVSNGSFKVGFRMAGFVFEGGSSDSRVLRVNVTSVDRLLSHHTCWKGDANL